MTLGERLQRLRKEKQMSQEELGNLLFVSRQTVSLWENNQTVPTVDNLIRLREVFGVSIDSILMGEVTESSESVLPTPSEAPASNYQEPLIERHCFSLDKKELKYIYKIFTMPLLKRLVVWIFLFFFSIFANLRDTSKEQTSYFVFLFVFIFLCINLVRYIFGLLATKKNAELVCTRTYIYEIFRDYVLLRVLNSEDEIKTQKVYFNEFTKCWETPFCYYLELKDKTVFIIKKSPYGTRSYLGYFCQHLKTPKTDLSSSKVAFLKMVGNVLFFGCFIGFFLAITISLDAASQNAGTLKDGMEALRVLHYFLPIPLLSIIAGILLNKNKIPNRKNIICGVIIGLLMLVYGFFPTIFNNVDNNIDSLEAQLGFSFPQTIGMNYQTTSDISGGKQVVTTLSFAEPDANEFEEFMKDDHRWIEGSNKAFTEILPQSSIDIPADFFLLYNTGTSEFGKIPENEGQHDFVYIAYNSETNVAYIYEYRYVI